MPAESIRPERSQTAIEAHDFGYQLVITSHFISTATITIQPTLK
ncbi:hypothetical protein [Oceanobacillus sp. CF4.6]